MKAAGPHGPAAFFFREMKKYLDDLIFRCIMSKVLTNTLSFNLIGNTNILRIFRYAGDLDVFAIFSVAKLDHFVKGSNKLCERSIR